MLMVAQTVAAASPAWTEIVITALGSSAIGAIVGGIITTSMRGNIEREEAWRTRMVEAADDLAGALSEADAAFNAILIGDVAEGRRALRDADGALDPEVRESLRSALEGVWKANSLLTRMELLYGSDSGAYREAQSVVYGLSGSVRIIEGNARVQRVIHAVLAEMRGNARERADLLRRSETAESRYRAYMSLEALPNDFDPDSDESAATWALSLRDAAVRSFRDFIEAARKELQGRNPGSQGSRRPRRVKVD